MRKFTSKLSVYQPSDGKILALIYLVPNEDARSVLGTIALVSGGIASESFPASSEDSTMISRLLVIIGIQPNETEPAIEFVKIDEWPSTRSFSSRVAAYGTVSKNFAATTSSLPNVK